MIEETFVTFETAKLLKEAGFPQDEDYRYYDGISGLLCTNPEDECICDIMYAVPTQAQAMRWLRDDMGLIVSPEYKYDGAWWVSLMSERFNLYKALHDADMDENLPTYEAAAEAGIQTACNYLIAKQK